MKTTKASSRRSPLSGFRIASRVSLWVVGSSGSCGTSRRVMGSACGPEMRMIPTAPTPDAVVIAAIVSTVMS